MKPNQIILYLIVLAVAFFGFNPDWGYMTGSPWWTHITYNFAHANIFHLAANMLVAFLLLFNRNDKWWMWLVCYAVATACSFIISTPKTTVGLSGMLFAYYGIIFLKDGAQWKPLIQTVVYMAVSCLFVSRMAVWLHFICLFIGVLIGGFLYIHNGIERKVNLYDNMKGE